jgi:DNA-binding NarL/FixJ family response regulator
MVRSILVADEHPVVRKGVVHILNSTPDLSVDGEASSGLELLELLRERTWDAVVMDLNMPGISGMDLLKQVQVIRPKVPVLILTVQREDIYARRLLQAGAAGFLSKESIVEELINAVQKICAGGRFVSRHLAEEIAFSFDTDPGRPPHEQLSDREFEVLRLLAAGMTPTAIAEKLCLSVKTVSTYRVRILEKLHMKTTADLIRYAVKSGFVE